MILANLRRYVSITKNHLLKTKGFKDARTNIPVSPHFIGLYFILFGWRKLLKSPLRFDAEFYSEQYPEVKKSGLTPFIHYLNYGKEKGFYRNTIERDYFHIKQSNAFSNAFYKNNYPDVNKTGIEPLLHFIQSGYQEERNPSPIFRTKNYHEQFPHVQAQRINPLCHFYYGLKNFIVIFGASTTLNSQRLGLDMCRMLQLMGYQLHIIVLGKMACHEEMESLGTMYYPHTLGANGIHELVFALHLKGCKNAIIHSEIPGSDVKTLKQHGYWLINVMHHSDNPHLCAKTLTMSDAIVLPDDNYLKFLPNTIALEKISVIMPNISLRQYVIHLLGLMRNPVKKISCILSGCGNQQALSNSLASIINQTYPINEVIFFDEDHDADNLEYIKKTLGEKKIDWISIPKEAKNRSIVKQWIHGAQIAQGEFIWVIKTNDSCQNTFIENLMPFFSDKKVHLTYALAEVVTRNSRVTAPKILQASYLRPINQELNLGLAIENTIPTISATIIRKAAFSCVNTTVYDYPNAGDWLFFIQLLSKGRIAYYHKRLTFYSNQKSNATALYAEEVESIHRYILENYTLCNHTIDLMKARVLEQYPQHSFALDYESFKIKKQDYPTVLIVIQQLTYGGAELFPIRLANYLAQNGYDIYLLSIDNTEANCDIVEMIEPSINFVNRITVSKKGALKQFVIDKKITIISSHSYESEKFIEQNSKDLPAYWMTTLHGHHDDLINNTQKTSDFINSFRKIFKRVDKVIYTADKNKLPFQKLPFSIEHKLTKINNGYPQSPCVPIDRALLGIQKEEIVLMFCARGIPEKGVEEAIHALIHLNNEPIETPYAYHLIVIADSPYIQSLQKQYTSPYIHWLGFQTNTASFIAMSDVGILPTYFISESQPLIIIEYLAGHKPCIATDIGEIRHMLISESHKAGELLTYNQGPVTVDELAKKIKRITQNKAIYQAYSEGAGELFKKFDLVCCANNYLELMQAHKIS